jgi:hypothetical protein
MTPTTAASTSGSTARSAAPTSEPAFLIYGSRFAELLELPEQPISGVPITKANELLIPDQQRAMRRIVELRRNGLSSRAISAAIAEDGIKLSHEGVKNVLAAAGNDPADFLHM